MCFHGGGEHPALDVGTTALQVGDGLAVADMDHVLADDRPFVQVLRHVVRRCANELDPAFLGDRKSVV